MKTPFIIRFILFSLLVGIMLCLPSGRAHATHLRAGNILVTKGSTCLDYTIKIVVYTSTEGPVLFGGDMDYLNFGDGSPIVLVPEIGIAGHPRDGSEFVVPGGIATYEIIDAENNIAKATYTITHSYGGVGYYTVSYIEPNRNAEIKNIAGSVNVTFYLESLIVIDGFLGCSSLPDLLVDPVDFACSGIAWFHNPGAQDSDGDSLSYHFVTPFSDNGVVVPNYRRPNNNEFYIDYPTGNEDNDGPPTFKIDSLYGTISWNAPEVSGEYNIAFIVVEWRKRRGKWYRMGFVRRDMQIIVQDDCSNERPELELTEEICVVAGETIEEIITGTDPDGHPVKIEAFSNIFVFDNVVNRSPATISPMPPDFRSSPDIVNFKWETTCEHVRDQPYTVIFRIEDQPGSTKKGLVNYKTMSIKVVGPPPSWNDASLNLTTRTATIKWDAYFCQNADSIQVWRKVDGSDFVPDTCTTGMPDGLGYRRIANVLVRNSNNTYIDNDGGKGLAPGAKYCYRLVAVFPRNRGGGESLVSLDTCVGPLLADVPLITNVSVIKTSETDGEILVRWVKPFEISETQFPPDYTYTIYRGTGYTRGTDVVEVATLPATNDDIISFTDTQLNTRNDIYNYSIKMVASNGEIPGESAVASSVRAEANTAGLAIDEALVTWGAVVPWSNQVADHPEHDVYRGDAGATENDLVLISTVDVTQEGFKFKDSGLEKREYCYRILTRGSYGNDNIAEPLENYSQIICVVPGDTVPPCAPVLSVARQDCDNEATILSMCTSSEIRNTITWTLPDDVECEADVFKIRIYRKLPGSETYDSLADVLATELSFIDSTLATYAACYKIRAIDRTGNRSELSESKCNDNCPYYELPNVFTPNGDTYNDEFGAYRFIDCGEDCSDHEVSIRLKCARFVESVKFTAYNRWGQEVYSYFGDGLVSGEGERSIYIDWDGRDDNGTKLSPGVYYYAAEVVFTTSNPSERKKTLKGWVQLLYDNAQ